ncbi:phage baseplate protein [Megamonas funiformis]|jgi:hypothetical protein|uniref:phage baseplate protein n=1 Tax=Megamonas funiformis TaxID=437897 RepID=UPI00266F6594|nr:hypothetical protein [Megamonas funiformis]
MASILSFLNQAVDSLISSSSSLNTGCKLVLSCAGESVTFPVSPPSFEVSNAYNNSTINVNSLGDINMLGKRGLTTIKFSSFFPAQAYDGIVNTTPDSPYSYIEKIKSFAQKGQPCKLAISNTNINLNVSIDSFDYSEKDGTNDVYFSISLREYRYILPNSNKLNNTTGLASRVAEEQKEKVINWYPGMDLMDVAAQSVGQFFPIEEQDAKQLSVFRTLAKTKNLNVGSVLHATKQSIKISDDTIINF